MIGDPAKFSEIGLPFTPTAPGSGVPYEDNVKGHSRRRFPGGPTASVKGHQRFGTRGGDLPGSNAEPGRPFYIEDLLSAPGEDPRRVKTHVFAYEGRWRDLKTKIIRDLSPRANSVLRNASGSKISLAPAPPAETP